MKKTQPTLRLVFLFLIWNASLIAQPRLGINISAVRDYSTEFHFVDIMKYMRAFENSSGIAFLETQLDTNGYPTFLNSGEEARMGFGDGTKNIWPQGQYHLYYDGIGTIESRNSNATLVSNDGKGHMVFNVSHGSTTWFGFKITSTTVGNHVRNIRIPMPGFESTYVSDPIHPQFRQNWRCLEAFRYMDFNSINASPIVKWADVRKPTSASQSSFFTSNGASPEAAVIISNSMEKDAWFCMPHQADDECIRQWAMMVKKKLKPNLKIYLEYSNEVWNWGFAQTTYSKDKGIALGITTNGAMEYYIYRSAQIWKIWEDVFGAEASRVINVAAWQSVDLYWQQKFLEYLKDPKYNPTGSKIELFATAPYIHDQNSSNANNYPMNNFFAGAFNEDLTAQKKDIANTYKLLKANNVAFAAYEGGQHYANPNNSGTATMYATANRDMRMKDLTYNYLNAWDSITSGSLMMYYSSVGQFGIYGSWGALEFHNQDTSTAPKYLALMKFIKCSSIITGRNEGSENTARFTVFPNPSNGNNLNIKLKEPLDHSGQIQIRITDLLGRPMYENSNLKGNDISIENLSLNKGLYMIFIQTGASRHYSELLVN